MSEMLTRRRLLINGGLAGLVLAGGRLDAFAHPGGPEGAAGQIEDLWATAATILGRIKAPVFPARDVLVTAHGAQGDGTTDCTAAFRAAIEACRAAGGGRVVVPAGRFLTGAIRLRSNVNLHVVEGGTIAFRHEAEAYLPLVLTRFEGVELMNYSPFIYALDETNVGIIGARHARRPGGRRALVELAAQPDAVQEHGCSRWRRRASRRNERVFGAGDSRLRVNFVQPYRCQNVLIEGVSIVNSPMWELNQQYVETRQTMHPLRYDTRAPQVRGREERC